MKNHVFCFVRPPRSFVGVENSTNILNCLKDKEEFLLDREKKFGLTIAFWTQVAGEKSTSMCRDKIIACFPVVGQQKTLSLCVLDLNKVGESPLMTFCGKDDKLLLGKIKTSIDTINWGKSVNWSIYGTGDFVVDLKKAVANTMTHQEGSSNAPMLTGTAALTALSNKMEAEKTATPVTYMMLAPFRQYDWLMTTEVKEWVDDLKEVLLTSSAKNKYIMVDEPTEKESKKGAKANVSRQVKRARKETDVMWDALFA